MGDALAKGLFIIVVLGMLVAWRTYVEPTPAPPPIGTYGELCAIGATRSCKTGPGTQVCALTGDVDIAEGYWQTCRP